MRTRQRGWKWIYPVIMLMAMPSARAQSLPCLIEPNRVVIEELIDHAVRQKILARRPAIESLFA